MARDHDSQTAYESVAWALDGRGQDRRPRIAIRTGCISLTPDLLDDRQQILGGLCGVRRHGARRARLIEKGENGEPDRAFRKRLLAGDRRIRPDL